MEDKRAQDFLIYIGIALAVVAIVLGGAYISATHPQIDNGAIEVPTLLFLVSLLMFGMLIRDYYTHVRTPRLWWMLAFMFSAHFAAGIVLGRLHLFQRGNDMLLVLTILIPERAVFRVIVGTLLGAKPIQYTSLGKNRY